MFNKKGVSVVVATALLLIVLGVFIAYFNNWFLSFNSENMADAQENSNLEITAKDIYGIENNILLIYNPTSSNVTLTKLYLDENECIFNNSKIVPGLNNISLTSCNFGTLSGSYEISIALGKKIITKKIFV